MCGCKCTSNSPGCSVSNPCSGLWSDGGGGGGETPQRERVRVVGCVKLGGKKMSRDIQTRPFLISQLSKSCSCGIKTDAVPVSDLGGREEEGPREAGGVGGGGGAGEKIKSKKRRERGGGSFSPRPPYRFHLP